MCDGNPRPDIPVSESCNSSEHHKPNCPQWCDLQRCEVEWDGTADCGWHVGWRFEIETGGETVTVEQVAVHDTDGWIAPEELRLTVLSRDFLLEAGVHSKVVSERLGHSNISITLDTYRHVSRRCRRTQSTELLG